MDKKQIGIGMVILLLVSGATYYITEELDKDYDLYQCDDKVMLCWKLSKINDNNISTRCYWNMSSSRRYKNCATGWFPSDKIEVEGEEVILQDYTAPIITFSTRAEAEDYIEQQRQGLSYNIELLRAEQEPYSEELKVFYLYHLLRDGEVIERFENLMIVQESATKEEMIDLANHRAEQLMNYWKPQVVISRGDKLN